MKFVIRVVLWWNKFRRVLCLPLMAPTDSRLVCEFVLLSALAVYGSQRVEWSKDRQKIRPVKGGRTSNVDILSCKWSYFALLHRAQRFSGKFQACRFTGFDNRRFMKVSFVPVILAEPSIHTAFSSHLSINSIDHRASTKSSAPAILVWKIVWCVTRAPAAQTWTKFQ